MSLSVRVLLKRFVVSMAVVSFALVLYWVLFMGIIAMLNGPSGILGVTGFLAIPGTAYVGLKIASLMWHLFVNIKYHQTIAHKEVVTALKKYVKNAKVAQAYDLLDAAIRYSTWKSLSDINKVLAEQSGKRMKLVLHDIPFVARADFFQEAARVELLFEGITVAQKPLWK